VPEITLGSLFDGIGVFPLAAARCGIVPVWASEIEAAPISITKRHFPGMKHLGDISELDQSDLEKFEAVIDSGEYTGSVKELINLAQNLDCFEFYSGISNEEDLGRMYIEDFEALQIPEHLIDYIDYEAYGRDVRINEGGHFAPGGYVFNNNSSFIEHYHGREDIPDEHKVFSMPKLNIREQMAAYKEVIDRSSLEGERLHPRKEVPER
jgi:hypothetical protein